jgi:hypothetical protein
MRKTILGLMLLTSAALVADEIAWGESRASAKKETPPRPFYYSENESEFFAYGEWLYWDAVTTDPMDYVLKTFQMNDNLGTFNTTKAKEKSLNYQFQSGFRVGGGYRIGRDKLSQNIRPWQIEVEYTSFHPNTSREVSGFGKNSSDPNFSKSEFLNIVLPVISNTQTLSAHSRSQLDYDKVDLKFAWPMWITPTVLMRLMLGGTGAWIKNDWKNRFFDNTNNDLLEKSDFKWNWSGGGIFGGTDIFMGVGSGFGFFANGSFGLLFGPMEQKEKLSSKQTGNSSNLLKFKAHFNEFQPYLDLGFGVDYKHWFKDKWMIQAALGWDFTWWFNLNQFGRITTSSRGVKGGQISIFDNQPSDLGFHGLSARLGFEF